MPSRINTIRTERHTQRTPAPLLCTRKGQYPNLPHQIAEICTPATTTPLLHLPLSEWHTLNPNTGLTTAALLPSLAELPCPGPPSIVSYIANKSAITFLASRQPSSTAFITDTPGKSLSVSTTLQSYNLTTDPLKIAELHKALGTDFVTAPSDHPHLHASPSATRLKKRVSRITKLREAFLETGAKRVIASIGGGDSPTQRRESVKQAVGNGVVGYSIDGLYAGESPGTREECVKAVIDELPEHGIRVLSGGSGAPWEVLAAVRQGMDVIEGDYPFETAVSGYATNLLQGGVVNVRDRRWETCKQVLVDGCKCPACLQGFSRGYLRHLFEVHEIMAVSLVSAHNLWDYFCWFERLRNAVQAGVFEDFVDDFERRREVVRVGKG